MSPPLPSTPTPTQASPWPVLQAPAHWHHIDFIADLHLQASDELTFAAWKNYILSTQADAVFILGDLFEVWVGDDVIEGTALDPHQAFGFEVRCAQVLKEATQRIAVYFMHGNRDFLLGPAFANACGMTVLNDPTTLDFACRRWLLSHGDALCLDDVDYLNFRAQVRSTEWQQAFLIKPLAERQAIARALRMQSETRKRSGITYADVDDNATCDWLSTAQASTLIHGHTHQPADHELLSDPELPRHRIVLSDWDATAEPARTEVLRLSIDTPHQAKRIHPCLSAHYNACGTEPRHK